MHNKSTLLYKKKNPLMTIVYINKPVIFKCEKGFLLHDLRFWRISLCGHPVQYM